MDANPLALHLVVTVQEAAALFSKAPNTVLMAIWRERLDARRNILDTGWLVYLPSLVKLWGEPSNRDAMERLENS